MPTMPRKKTNRCLEREADDRARSRVARASAELRLLLRLAARGGSYATIGMTVSATRSDGDHDDADRDADVEHEPHEAAAGRSRGRSSG